MITKNRSLEEAKTEVKDWEERPKCPKCKTDILRYIGEGCQAWFWESDNES